MTKIIQNTRVTAWAKWKASSFSSVIVSCRNSRSAGLRNNMGEGMGSKQSKRSGEDCVLAGSIPPPCSLLSQSAMVSWGILRKLVSCGNKVFHIPAAHKDRWPYQQAPQENTNYVLTGDKRSGLLFGSRQERCSLFRRSTNLFFVLLSHSAHTVCWFSHTAKQGKTHTLPKVVSCNEKQC